VAEKQRELEEEKEEIERRKREEERERRWVKCETTDWGRLTIPVLQPPDAVSPESFQLKILASIMHFIRYILKVEYSTISVVRIYFNFITVNLTNVSFSISIITEYASAVSWRFASVDNVYKAYYHWCYFLTVIITGYIRQITSLVL